VKSFFGGKDTKESEQESDDKNKTATDADEAKATNSTEEPKESVSIIKIPLSIEYIPTGLTPLNDREKAIAKKRYFILEMICGSHTHISFSL
jgi:hypoxia up-regulated 1